MEENSPVHQWVQHGQMTVFLRHRHLATALMNLTKLPRKEPDERQKFRMKTC
jgi:hypothetical protein